MGPVTAMNDSFVPLNKTVATGRNQSDFRVTVLEQSENARSFQPLGHAGAKAGAGGQHEPRVTLQRDGGRVSAIRIQCSCGQVIELTCAYQAASTEGKG